jgi:hypothetical protein
MICDECGKEIPSGWGKDSEITNIMGLIICAECKPKACEQKGWKQSTNCYNCPEQCDKFRMYIEMQNKEPK